MAGRVPMVSRDVNGIAIEQRQTDGFINGTAMSVAHGKDLTQWFRTKDTLELFQALAEDLGLDINSVDLQNSDVSTLSAAKYVEMFPSLIFSKRGSPENGGGTWLHPDLAIQLAQVCNKPFAIRVSRWVREWMTSAYNPIQLEADADRVSLRDELKDKKRLELTGQVKAFLTKAGIYDPKSKETGIFFGRVHNEVNLALTGEKAIAMRSRLELHLGTKVSESELLRDYFPMIDLANYAALCQAAANNMVRGEHPIDAVRLAAKQVLPLEYVAKPIDFTERIDLVRRRLEQRDQLLLIGRQSA